MLVRPFARRAEGLVLEADRIVDIAHLAADRDLAAGQERIGVALAEFGAPGELAAASRRPP